MRIYKIFIYSYSYSTSYKQTFYNAGENYVKIEIYLNYIAFL